MKTNYFKSLLASLVAMLVALPSWGVDGDTFTANTADGVELTFKIISESSKTCEVMGRTSQSSSSGTITIPSSVNGYSVTSIGDWAFCGCSGLTSITIPSSVTSIGGAAFQECSGLTSIVIPEGVTSIGAQTFWGCSGLTTITIPSSVTSIREYAFNGCTGLTSVTIPSGVTIIEGAAFLGCTGLTSITIPEGVTSIGSYAFNGCTGLTSVTIPSSVTSIGERAFSSCTGLTSIVISEGVTSIGKYAFIGCMGLTSVTIPSSVTSIGDSAFSDCTGLTSITIPEGVTSIGYDAFRSCISLTSIIIPSSVTSIGAQAFSFCSGLTSVTIPEGVTTIGYYAFHSCTGLTSITIPSSVTNLEWGAFYHCAGLTSITIPSGVTSIGNLMFAGCSGLTSVTIPSSVTSIGEWAFSECTGLTSITIPPSVTIIEDFVFASCTGLISITIPSSVTSIDWYAFNGCTGLTAITIPEGVTGIGIGAFKGCTGLTSVISKIKTPFAFDSAAFDGLSSDCLLTVPDGTKDAYIAAGWTTDVFKGGIVEEATIIVEEPTTINLIDGEDFAGTEHLDMDEITYSRTYKNTNWQAWYVPFDLTLTSETMAHFAFAKFAGTYTDEDGTFYITVVRLKEGDVVKANTPYCVQAKVADSSNPQVITLTDATLKHATVNSFYVLSSEKKITFWGNYTRRTVTAEDQNIYALSGGKYAKQLTGYTLAPFRCFFTIEDREDNPYASAPNPSEVKIKVIGEDDTTGLEMVQGSMYKVQVDEPMYDMQGRRVAKEKAKSGIYIINGKKVFVR